MGKYEFQAVDIGGHHDVFPVGVLVDQDAGVIPGHDYITQNCERPVVAGRGADAGLSVGGLRGLHIVGVGVDEDVLDLALHRVQQIDAADTGIIVGADVQVPQAHIDPRKRVVHFVGGVGSKDDRRPRFRQAFDNRAILRKRKCADRPEDRGRFALARDLYGNPLFCSGNDNPAAVDPVRDKHFPPPAAITAFRQAENASVLSVLSSPTAP